MALKSLAHHANVASVDLSGTSGYDLSTLPANVAVKK